MCSFEAADVSAGASACLVSLFGFLMLHSPLIREFMCCRCPLAQVGIRSLYIVVRFHTLCASSADFREQAPSACSCIHCVVHLR